MELARNKVDNDPLNIIGNTYYKNGKEKKTRKIISYNSNSKKYLVNVEGSDSLEYPSDVVESFITRGAWLINFNPETKSDFMDPNDIPQAVLKYPDDHMSPSHFIGAGAMLSDRTRSRIEKGIYSMGLNDTLKDPSIHELMHSPPCKSHGKNNNEIEIAEVSLKKRSKRIKLKY